MRAYCLSFHAPYACEHTGACCTAPWPLPIEHDAVERLRTRGLIRIPQRAYVRPLHPPVNGVSLALATATDGACVFFDREGGRLCRVHRDAGADLLPVACRNFPRVTLRDRRGVFITLSSLCPTAARLLLTAGDMKIVEAPATLSLAGQVEGLDATEVMPPLLRPGMLMDLEGYARWEAEGIAVLGDRALAARAAVAVIGDATRDVCTWHPGGETLAGRAGRAFDRARSSAPVSPSIPPLEHAVKAFLASHLFASWAAYQRGGLHAVVDELQQALVLVGAEHRSDDSLVAAARAADLRLRHG